MSERPLVSCIVPVRDGESHLAATLESILAQTYSHTEVVVVDDGSMDRTPSVARAFGDRVTYIRQEASHPSVARNLGIQETSGELVAFLDADDLWHREKLERQVGQFLTRAELSACVTHAQNFVSEECLEQDVRTHPSRMVPVPAFFASATMVRRQAFRVVGTLDTSLRHGDLPDWFARARHHDLQIAVLKDVLVWRRLHQSNRSSRFSERSREEFLEIVKRNLDRRRGRVAGG